MSDCIFCKLANGEIPTDMVYEDDIMAVFRDVNPQAPVHVLMVPKKHVASLTEAEDEGMLGHILGKVKDLVPVLGLENGYRVVINCGEDGEQSVPHLHFHVLGRRKLTWPPG